MNGEAEGYDPTRLVFVAGLHRSGTTPLARAIAAHADVSGLTATGVKEDEGQHLQSIYPKAKVYGGPGRFARDPRAHLTEDSPLVTVDNARALWQSWEPYWDTRRRLLLEKSPPNIVMSRFLASLFPGSAYIVVLRHPIVVALGTQKWRRLISRHWENHTTIEEMIEHWLIAHRIMREDLKHRDRYLILRYEDLVGDPQRELSKIQNLLGLSSPIPADGISAHSSPYEAEWDRMATGSVFQRRRRRRIEDRFAADLATFGYRCDDLSFHSAEWPAPS